MPIKSNGYFNSPAFAQAASNLSALFEPPSGADAAGWAAASAKRDEASRLKQLFDYAQNPNFDQQQFDRLGVGAGAYNPTQSYYSVDQGNATTRRGQDVTAATSRANNTDDNARMLAAEKLGGLQKLYGPLSQGEIAPAMPAEIATQFGAPGAIDQRTGADKPLSETELKARVLQGMPQNLQEAAAFGSTPIEPVVTPNGPRNATRVDAIGQEPFVPSKGAGTTMTMPDGTVVQVGGDKLPEAQGKLVNYGTTAEAMLPVLDQLGPNLMDPTGAISEASPSIGTFKPGNYAQSQDFQKARITGERFVQSILRNESGAATPDAEIQHYNATFLPVPGDQPETVRLKSWLRKTAVEALKGGMTKDARIAAVNAAAAAGPPPDFMPNAAPAAAATGAPAPAPGGAPAPAAGAIRHYNPATGKIE